MLYSSKLVVFLLIIVIDYYNYNKFSTNCVEVTIETSKTLNNSMDFTKFDDGFFAINEMNGFLPKMDPLEILPQPFSQIQLILDNLPTLIHSKVGLETQIRNLPNYLSQIQELIAINKDGRDQAQNHEEYQSDILIIHALFRAYAFLSSAYLLQPTFLHYQKTGVYGLAKNILPINLTQPFEALATRLGIFPFLDYHYAYTLGNYVKINKNSSTSSFHYSNLKLAVSFSGSSDEIGFVTIHVEINSKTPRLIAGIKKFVSADKNDDDNKLAGLNLILEATKDINIARAQMWTASNYKHYNLFRPFIMGIAGNDAIFGPEGVEYEGSLTHPNPNQRKRYYRGETGAQDDTIPTLDIFTGVVHYYPHNPLTTYLLDLRRYRPRIFQSFFTELAKHSIHDYKQLRLDGQKTLYYILDEIYNFRAGHWEFVQNYIMKNTNYGVATGGTPITSWLPNQIQAVLNYMKDLLDEICKVDEEFYNVHVQELAGRNNLYCNNSSATSYLNFGKNKPYSK